jgi:hypothetical protein
MKRVSVVALGVVLVAARARAQPNAFTCARAITNVGS